MKNIVIGIGEVLWDVLKSTVPGVLDTKILGGAPANFVFHSRQLGLDGIIVSAVGDNPDGCEIKDELTSRGIRSLLKVVAGCASGVVNATPQPDGETHYEIKQNVAYDHIPYSPELDEYIPDVKAVCFGTLAQRTGGDTCQTIRRFLSALGDDVYKVYDINLRPTCEIDECADEIFVSSLELANILKINQVEFPRLMKLLDIHEGSDEKNCHVLMDRFNLRAVVHSLGGDGSRIYYRNDRQQIEISDVDDVDIDKLAAELGVEKDPNADFVGAGDSLTAALIAGLVKGLPMHEAHVRASRVATYVCTRQGAMPVLDERLLF